MKYLPDVTKIQAAGTSPSSLTGTLRFEARFESETWQAPRPNGPS